MASVVSIICGTVQATKKGCVAVYTSIQRDS